MEETTQSHSSSWLAYAIIALLVGGGAGFWFGQEIGREAGYARAEAEILENAALVERARAADNADTATQNPLAEVKTNPLEGVKTNPFEDVKLNPFE
ncbi:MAG: hypothetical protein A3C84_04595 [Candidatus Ryanbacteria bacterium RIFCSPHIGHO2_02_FULL_48_12]|uniref:Uncharacterized protein n=1 Tax=Candidatus Ryanbacteria bacterium RIFCSPHIGHO2_01_FULL_48_27 TaxID=1802115 RepID=A0A1G2G745_9BACT|nr:MAG: hypothetical protein A2756_02205 [Candidatus Ryanbacteria bacterium RIFCSPHIGHO2_01_FULL_48_27]OGZ49858.1 MAG: hypothetical protein A3C84_04595 [Candidatus Ryanbacteria bacterium RIFCSPHIGHO2_02_FULL_48_12]